MHATCTEVCKFALLVCKNELKCAKIVSILIIGHPKMPYFTGFVIVVSKYISVGRDAFRYDYKS